MNEVEKKELARDFSTAVLTAASRKVELSQEQIEKLRAAIVREFEEIVAPFLP